METAELPVETEEQEEQDAGAPVEEGAEATRSAAHLFQYSQYVHAGTGARECEHAEDGKCQESDHFHAWVCLPNQLQHADIQEKARAAKARRKRAMRDAGTDGRAASDAYVTLESELDDLMRGDREALLTMLFERESRQHLGEWVLELREDERFETYNQDAEEYRRQAALPEDERDADEWAQLDKAMTEFGDAVEQRIEREREREIGAMRGMEDEQIRDLVRESRIEGESTEYYTHIYYIWLGFVGTRVPPGGMNAKRYFKTLDDFRNGPPEAIEAISETLRELETRTVRGDAAGN